MGASLPRARRRNYKKKSPYTRLLVIIPCLALLIALAVFYVGRYQKTLAYRQYPLSYKELIVEKAEDFNLQPWHIAAVVRCESSFNPDATSSAGARGLMQIMPETGAWLAGKFGEEADFDPAALYDPETNLKYGCWFLNWLMARYDENVVLATCAYHAGHGTVDKWLADPAVSADGKTIDPANIPYASTKTYVSRILTAYDKYQELYDFTSTGGAAQE